MLQANHNMHSVTTSRTAYMRPHEGHDPIMYLHPIFNEKVIDALNKIGDHF